MASAFRSQNFSAGSDSTGMIKRNLNEPLPKKPVNTVFGINRIYFMLLVAVLIAAVIGGAVAGAVLHKSKKGDSSLSQSSSSTSNTATLTEASSHNSTTPSPTVGPSTPGTPPSTPTTSATPIQLVSNVPVSIDTSTPEYTATLALNPVTVVTCGLTNGLTRCVGWFIANMTLINSACAKFPDFADDVTSSINIMEENAVCSFFSSDNCGDQAFFFLNGGTNSQDPKILASKISSLLCARLTAPSSTPAPGSSFG